MPTPRKTQLSAVEPNVAARKAQTLQYDIAVARYNYSRSYEWRNISKRRERFSTIFTFGIMIASAILSILYKDEYLKYFPYATENNSFLYVGALFLAATVLSIPLSRLIFPEKAWPDILLTYNREAVEAAAKSGIELVLPETPAPEKKLLTEEEFSKLDSEVLRLRKIIGILSLVIYFSIKAFMFTVFFDYAISRLPSPTHSPVLTLSLAFGIFIAIFIVPLVVLNLIGRWARIGGYGIIPYRK